LSKRFLREITLVTANTASIAINTQYMVVDLFAIRFE